MVTLLRDHLLCKVRKFGKYEWLIIFEVNSAFVKKWSVGMTKIPTKREAYVNKAPVKNVM